MFSYETSLREKNRRLLANSRERRRVHTLNDMYQQLLSLLPPAAKRIKLSRVQILREAINYINSLRAYLMLENIEGISAEVLFPHAFSRRIYDNRLQSYRRIFIPSEDFIQHSTPIDNNQ
ncbi:unnamed protein product [Caenorhabditis angaria]|uniref:BHLH domain-containing protein n=1 Tax=Caenorhabditis angaria TaxID=860376 RepID=A0A9P1J275_9PELO|nr:unnamed protein product [Caenorhabditis angaria]